MEPLLQIWSYEDAPEKLKIQSEINNPRWLMVLNRDINIEMWDWINSSIPKPNDTWFISNHFVVVW